MVRIYKVPVSLLNDKCGAAEAERGRIVRARNRRIAGSAIDGLTETLVSPELNDSFEVIHSVFVASSQLSNDKERPPQEVGYVISGKLDLYLSDEKFIGSAGDSFRIRNEAFCWANPYAAATIAL